MKMNLKLQSDYYNNLDSFFYQKILPNKFENGELIFLNYELALKLGIDPNFLKENYKIFLGDLDNLKDINPIAMAYSGHQFGHYTRLGDGRAILLGEYKDAFGVLWDIQLKGAGKTKYSRRGDGLCTFSSTIREYIISESMHYLGIDTTRPLAILKTGHPVYRYGAQAGGLLVRVSKSHIRFGTFEYAYEAGGDDRVKQLADYAIERYFPEFKDKRAKYFLFLEKIVDTQAQLIAKWMSKGFIHGVMNTDNMNISGETIDYGPCAFMDYYNPDTVFSSIDYFGRYRYRNQPNIGRWNLSLFVQIFKNLVGESFHQRSALVALYESFMPLYEKYYLKEMLKKIGINKIREGDKELIDMLLKLLEKYRTDYTNFFYELTLGIREEKIFQTKEFLEFESLWMARIKKIGLNAINSRMRNNNPKIIPRNHLVERAIKEAEEGNFNFVKEFLEYLKAPYEYEEYLPKEFKEPMPYEDLVSYKTYCGT
ncbi:MAG: YdiU family protein [Tissierellia bacterium]|nr:YdiU family protein [Tissierellia bacterium]